MERKVKGTLVKVITKGIKSDKVHEKEYNELLSDKAKDYLNQRIMDSIWYSYEVYFELYNTLIKVVAKNNRELVIKWGRNFGETVMTSIYKNLITGGDARKLVQMYPRFHTMLFNFGSTSLEWITDNELIYTLSDFDPKFELWYYTTIGWTQRALELCLKKKVNFTFLKKSWEGDDVTQFKLYWST
ncbi:MAG: hypothetical protein JW891_04625 [Candidatus Lokiarchaeota archaeon]|nr:hypothetical protein [Candidatus Lokiarchaeota archaeon]